MKLMHRFIITLSGMLLACVVTSSYSQSDTISPAKYSLDAAAASVNYPQACSGYPSSPGEAPCYGWSAFQKQVPSQLYNNLYHLWLKPSATIKAAYNNKNFIQSTATLSNLLEAYNKTQQLLASNSPMFGFSQSEFAGKTQSFLKAVTAVTNALVKDPSNANVTSALSKAYTDFMNASQLNHLNASEMGKQPMTTNSKVLEKIMEQLNGNLSTALNTAAQQVLPPSASTKQTMSQPIQIKTDELSLPRVQNSSPEAQTPSSAY